MSAWGKFRLALVRFGFWIWIVPGGYYTWSKLWRLLLEWKYRKQKLTQFTRFEQLIAALQRMEWVQDPAKGLFDVISRPEKVEYAFQLARLQNLAPKVGDCDEFAIYAASRIADLRTRRQVPFTPYFMTINWFDNRGAFRGHNICALKGDNGQWGHIGNWFGGTPQWGFASAHDIALWFAERTPQYGVGKLIGWALANPDLSRFTSRVWDA